MTFSKMVRWALPILAALYSQQGFAGDVYNLYFKNPNELKESENAKKEEKESKPEAPKEVKPPEPVIEKNTSAVVPPNITINNNLTTTPPKEPAPLRQAEIVDDAPEFVEVPPEQREGRTHLSFLFGGTAYVPAIDGTPNMPSAEYAGGGLSFAIGVHPTDWLGLRGWASVFRTLGQRYSWIGGGDLEFTPFRIPSGNFDVFSIGLLAGVHSKLPDQVGSGFPGHVGLRTDLNFARSFGITCAVRVAREFIMPETGLVARF